VEGCAWLPGLLVRPGLNAVGPLSLFAVFFPLTTRSCCATILEGPNKKVVEGGRLALNAEAG